MRRWIRALWDRFRPAEIPQGWDVDSLDEIRPHFTDPWRLDDEDTAVVIIVDEHLGPLDVIDPEPPVLYDALRVLHSVDLHWRPGWLDWAVA